MVNKTLKQLFDESKLRDAYWVEKVKLQFAEELANLMARREINKSELANRFGSSPAYITKALRGDVNFTIETIVKLVRAVKGQVHIHLSAAEDGCRWVDVINGTARFKRSLFPKGDFRPIENKIYSAKQLKTEVNNAHSSAAA